MFCFWAEFVSVVDFIPVKRIQKVVRKSELDMTYFTSEAFQLFAHLENKFQIKMLVKTSKITLKSLQIEVNTFKEELKLTKKELNDVKEELKNVKEEMKYIIGRKKN